MSKNPADASDQIQVLIAISAALLSIVFATNAASYVVAENTIGNLKTFYFFAGVPAVGLTIVWLWKLRAFKDMRLVEFVRGDFVSGFVGESMYKAYAVSWAVTVVALLVTIRIDTANALPIGFLANATIALMSVSLSATFLYLYLDIGTNKHDG